MGIQGQFGLTFTEARLLGILVNSNKPSRAYIMDCLYSHRIAHPDIKILDVLVCKLRKKLSLHDIKIETYHGRGYWLSAETKERLLSFIEPVSEFTESVVAI